MENLWYETFHARRCTYRRGKVPPGLFLPSTVRDYSYWHGDYHMNYNIQVAFLGRLYGQSSGLGRRLLRRHRLCIADGPQDRQGLLWLPGAFHPAFDVSHPGEDDHFGAVPMGRMAYMTGWAMTSVLVALSLHARQGVAPLDRLSGDPRLRGCFTPIFLKKRADGLYHIFPSNQGEDGFTGNAKDYTDRAQVMRHMRYCLRAAIRPARFWTWTSDLRAQWRERLEHAAGDDGRPPLVLSGLEKERYEANPPEFGYGRPYRPQPDQFDYVRRRDYHGMIWRDISDPIR